MNFRAFADSLAFLAIGFLDAEGQFVSLAKNEFHLSNAVAFLTPLATPPGLLSL